MLHLVRHDPTLVVLSFVVAYFASLTALDMGTRLRRATGKARRLWLTGSAVVLGGGIWSMHFVAMLAMDAGVPVGFAPGLTLLSLLVAILIVAVGFHVVTAREKPSIARQLSAGAIVGAGVAVMHYAGMAAVVLPGYLKYQPLLVAASVVIAMVAATAALWLTLNLKHLWQRAAAAGIMAVAVTGMHFTGMAATTICASPAAHGTGDPMSRAFLAAGVCAGVFLILCLAMVCVFVDRRFELLAEREAETLRASNQRLQAEVDERQAAQRELLAAHTALKTTQEDVRDLLDNADQGFLTFGPDLRVDEQSSAICAEILGRPPAGQPILALLWRGCPADDVDNIRETLASLFRDADDYMRELKIELLPTEATLDGRALKLGYKFLSGRNRLMVVLTDVTETVRLALSVEAERRRLEMTVLAMREADTFWSLVADYRAFLDHELPELADRFGEAIGSGEMQRRLHTFKGLLAQFSFHESPQRLHDVETALAGATDWTPEAARQALAVGILVQALEHDLSVMGQPGEDGAAPDATPDPLPKFARAAREALADPAEPRLSPRLNDLLKALAETGMIEARATLAVYSRSLPDLAARLGKQLAPIEVAGERVFVDPDRHRAFFRSLVHVLRNAVDHGLEAAEDRLAAGKPEDGRITCVVRRRRDALEIVIADDGAGIDRETLEARLLAEGEPPGRVRRMSLADLVFRPGLSSRDEVGSVSGRGVGLAAVKYELDRLGGAVSASSVTGVGAEFVFRLPIQDDTASRLPAQLRKVAS